MPLATVTGGEPVYGRGGHYAFIPFTITFPLLRPPCFLPFPRHHLSSQRLDCNSVTFSGIDIDAINVTLVTGRNENKEENVRMQRCGNPECGVLIHHDPGSGKWYCSNKCRQKAYRLRHRLQGAAIVRIVCRCTNCGIKFETLRRRQRFCSNSCRSSFHQQQKRLNIKESIEA